MTRLPVRNAARDTGPEAKPSVDSKRNPQPECPVFGTMAMMLRNALTALAIIFSSAHLSGGEKPWFVEVGESAGISHRHHNRIFENEYARTMQGYTALGAAVAVADYDGDGFQDVFLTDSSLDGSNRLFRNRGDGTFTDVTTHAGVAGGNDELNASAAALWLDHDGDGHPDLLVVRFGTSLLYRNRGDGTFLEVSGQVGLTSKRQNSIAAISFDFDRDGDLDLFLGNYFQDVNIFKPTRTNFFPESFETADNGGGVTVYRNDGASGFVEVTASAGLRLSGWTLDLGHADADFDGDEDLYIACDFGTDRFFVNNGDGTFRDATAEAIGIDSKKGMNVDWGDFDRDGLFDIYVTNITDDYMREGNFLWRNNGDLTFSDVARETETFDTGWGWAGKFFDVDNDGWLDLYVVNGWVSAGPQSYVPLIFDMILRNSEGEKVDDLSDLRKWPPIDDMSLSGHQRMKLFHNQDGQVFREVGKRHGVDSQLDGRGIAIADFDNDGRLDMIVSIVNSRPLLFRNTRPADSASNWIQFSLRGTSPNTLAVGAKIEVKTSEGRAVEFVNGGNGFASQSSQRLHFGLGRADQVDSVTVTWPSGGRETIGPLKAGRLYHIEEGRAATTSNTLREEK